MTEQVMTNAEYVNADGVICPFCESHDIEASNANVDNIGVVEDVGCHSCNAEWEDSYYMAAISDDNGEAMSPDTFIQYLKHGAQQCPHCASRNIEAGNLSCDHANKNAAVTCNDCKKDWMEVFKLEGMLGGNQAA